MTCIPLIAVFCDISDSRDENQFLFLSFNYRSPHVITRLVIMNSNQTQSNDSTRIVNAFKALLHQYLHSSDGNKVTKSES